MIFIRENKNGPTVEADAVGWHEWVALTGRVESAAGFVADLILLTFVNGKLPARWPSFKWM